MSWKHSKPFYKSGKYPKYSIGEILFLWESEKMEIPGQIRHWCEPYKVVDVSTKKSGWFFKEFTYTAERVANGKKTKNIYESEFEATQKDDWIEKTDFM